MNFSCLIPVFNAKPHHLFECLSSVVNQSLKANEIIVIDDGSTSRETKAALLSAKSIYEIKLFTFEQNRGISVALNFGISLAENEWIARMDSDDICFTTRFEDQVKFINQHPDASIYGTDAFCFLDSDLYRNQYTLMQLSPTYFCPTFTDPYLWCTNHPTVFYRKSVMEANPYDENLKRAQDVHLWADMLRRGHRVRNLNKVLLSYRVHS